jgi:DNA invertase Pin-like site-specific DNA recombinase
MTVRAYARVSTDRQAVEGHGLDAQRAAIQAEADRRSWPDLAWYVDGGQSGKNLERPAMQRLLAELRSDDVLVVAKLDRLSRSLVDFAGLMERAQRQRWNVIALDLGIDMATPNGEFMASVLAAMARWERRIIGQRTREGMAAARAKGHLPGRRSALPAWVQERLLRDEMAGLTFRAMAARLNDEDVPTASGGPVWGPSTVYSAIRSAKLERAALVCRQEFMGLADR